MKFGTNTIKQNMPCGHRCIEANRCIQGLKPPVDLYWFFEISIRTEKKISVRTEKKNSVSSY